MRIALQSAVLIYGRYGGIWRNIQLCQWQSFQEPTSFLFRLHPYFCFNKNLNFSFWFRFTPGIINSEHFSEILILKKSVYCQIILASSSPVLCPILYFKINGTSAKIILITARGTFSACNRWFRNIFKNVKLSIGHNHNCLQIQNQVKVVPRI